MNSHFAQSSTPGVSRSKLRRRTIGVSPIRSVIFSATRSRARRTCSAWTSASAAVGPSFIETALVVMPGSSRARTGAHRRKTSRTPSRRRRSTPGPMGDRWCAARRRRAAAAVCRARATESPSAPARSSSTSAAASSPAMTAAAPSASAGRAAGASGTSRDACGHGPWRRNETTSTAALRARATTTGMPRRTDARNMGSSSNPDRTATSQPARTSTQSAAPRRPGATPRSCSVGIACRKPPRRPRSAARRVRRTRRSRPTPPAASARMAISAVRSSPTTATVAPTMRVLALEPDGRQRNLRARTAGEPPEPEATCRPRWPERSRSRRCP